MNTLLRPALVLLLILTLITGVVYPFVVTGLAAVLFPQQAGGSLLLRDGKPIGSSLIGQSFTEPKYFWSRPSATSPQPYNGLASGGSNLGPLNPALIDAVRARADALHTADPGNTAPVPVDLVTASASGLDPDISVAAANYQAARVARVRGLNVGVVQALIAEHARGRLFGWLGEPRVNVLQLNLALDEVHAPSAR
ncbi:MAG TPA: potassium-transporting ATPase subunit KdpC [Steroidobacteraceae bacterium]|nr:potassium-transporting ATPase subunit KdpC [Steroidobacteraceae bacterium]